MTRTVPARRGRFPESTNWVSPDRLITGMSRLPASTSVNVEHQFPVFSDRTPPLFGQASHIVDQSDQVIPVNGYPLFLHTVFATGGSEALVCFFVVQNRSG